jgi:hypothetical protein
MSCTHTYAIAQVVVQNTRSVGIHVSPLVVVVLETMATLILALLKECQRLGKIQPSTSRYWFYHVTLSIIKNWY